MAALVTCAGASVLDMRIVMPVRGPWFARGRLDTATAPTGEVTIEAVDGIELTGTIRTSSVYMDAAHVEIVGGANGLGTVVSGYYREAFLRVALNALCSQSGESASSTIAAAVLNVTLPAWTMAGTAGAGLDALAAFASAQLDSDIGWRILDDGTIWIGAETWTTETLPDHAVVIDAKPEIGAYLIASETPTLLPGAALTDVGNVREVVHVIEPGKVRTWAMV